MKVHSLYLVSCLNNTAGVDGMSDPGSTDTLQWHETNIKPIQIPTDGDNYKKIASDDVSAHVDWIMSEVPWFKNDLEAAKERLSKTDMQVLEYLFPRTIGKDITIPSRKLIDSALDTFDHIERSYKEAERDGMTNIKAFSIQNLFFGNDQQEKKQIYTVMKSYTQAMEKIGRDPAIDNMKQLLTGSEKIYERGQYLPMFKGDAASMAREEYYSIGDMVPIHFDRVVTSIPRSAHRLNRFQMDDKMSFSLRAALVNDLIDNGRDGWKRVGWIDGLIHGMKDDRMWIRSYFPNEYLMEMFPIEIGRAACDKEVVDYINRMRGSSSDWNALERTRKRGEPLVDVLSTVDFSSIKKVKDRRDHVIAMTCAINISHEWFNEWKDKWYKDEATKFFDAIPDKKLSSIMKDVHAHFTKPRSKPVNVTNINAFLKERGA